MDWGLFVKTLAENWAVIQESSPLIFILAGLIAWAAFRFGQADNAKELRVERALRALAEKGEKIVKDAAAELKKKRATQSQESATPLDVYSMVARPELRPAFEELTSTKGLHLSVDPREKTPNVGLYVNLTESEIERMAAARYFLDRGLVGVVKPDLAGNGVTVTASVTATGVYETLPKLPDGEKK
jgi:hypothetical protein